MYTSFLFSKWLKMCIALLNWWFVFMVLASRCWNPNASDWIWRQGNWVMLCTNVCILWLNKKFYTCHFSSSLVNINFVSYTLLVDIFLSATKNSKIIATCYMTRARVHAKLHGPHSVKPLSHYIFTNFQAEGCLVRGLQSGMTDNLAKKNGIDSDQKLLPTPPNFKFFLPVHSWKSFVHKSHLQCTSPSRFKIQYLCSLPPSK